MLFFQRSSHYPRQVLTVVIPTSGDQHPVLTFENTCAYGLRMHKVKVNTFKDLSLYFQTLEYSFF